VQTPESWTEDEEASGVVVVRFGHTLPVGAESRLKAPFGFG
jgi:hypothetical protein